MKRLLIFALCVLLMVAKASAQLIINEVMQSNIDCVMDDLNQYPDSWVELYNSGNSTVNLSEYSLSDTLAPELAYKLPSKTVVAKACQLVYCDKENRSLHTHFRLESGKGCRLYLFHNGMLADSLYIERKQPAPNIAYGRAFDGSGTWVYMLSPTPGKSNSGGIVNGTQILGEPIFSIQGRVYESGQSFTLTLSLPEGCPSETVIRYTTNGSEPTLENSILYSGKGISISSNRVIRARLFRNGWLSPRSTTHSYLFLDRKQTLPVVSIVTDAKHLTDNKIGICVDGTYSSSRKNYEYDWRRPINFELFAGPQTDAALNQLCETRVSGAASRGCALKSLALYANKRFGEKHFKYEFFPDQRPGQQKFKSLVLRNAGNDFDYLYMRDALAQRVMAQHQDMDWQAWQPAIVFINGTYKGILNIRERGNENNIYTNYDGLEDIDLYENSTLKAGTSDHMEAFQQFYKQSGHTRSEYEEWMDCEEFMNLMAMQIFFNNVDFPGNNAELWRPRVEGGRWRWIAKDVDYIMNLYSSCPATYNYVQWLYNPNYNASMNWANKSEATLFFRHLMEDPTFCRDVCDRMAIFMDDFLNYSSIWNEFWSPMYETIRAEYPIHRKIYNPWWPNYSDEMNIARTFLQSRPQNVFTFLKEQYKLGNILSLQVNQSLSTLDREKIKLMANGVTVSKASLSGSFWTGRKLTLSAKPVDHTGVSAWNVVEYGSTGRKERIVEGAVLSIDIPTSCTQLVVNAVLGEVSGIEEMAHEPAEIESEGYYDLSGIRYEHRPMQKPILVKGKVVVR